jgi:hypothetical protein
MSRTAMIVLPAPGILSEQKSKGLAGQHRVVDGCDLVRKRLDQRSMYGENGVEQVG